jgi:hypothetical protein
MPRIYDPSGITPERAVGMVGRAIVIVIILLLGTWATFNMVEQVDASEIVVVQNRFTGSLKWVTQQGPICQCFGKLTAYPKRSIYQFEAPVVFNDGGKGIIHGSVQYELPLDATNLTDLHTRYGSGEAIAKQVMEVTTKKVIYMTGPVMSSRESYAEKRNYLISYAQDQIDNGIYQTRRVQREEVDQFTGLKRSVAVAEIVTGQDGRPARQEQSVVAEFGLRAFNFAIEQIDYDDVVETQIQDQQKITQSVQTSIAEALKAQQAAITSEQQGRAAAAQAKWAQEVVKAKAVTDAERDRDVAKLKVEQAEAYKTEQMLRGDADAGYKRKVLEADGALAQKLATYERVMGRWAEAFEKHTQPLVPTIMNGAPSGQGGNFASSLMETISTKAALDLAVTVRPSGGGRGGGAGGGSR